MAVANFVALLGRMSITTNDESFWRSASVSPHWRGFRKARSGCLCSDPKKLCTPGIWIAVTGNKEAVALLLAGTDVDEFCAERLGQPVGEEELLIGLTARGNDGGSGPDMGFECLGSGSDGLLPAEGGTIEHGSFQAILAVNVGIVQAVRVGHPIGIDRLILAGSDPMDLILTAADDDVGAGAAGRVDGLGFFQEPDAHLEAEILGGQRADGADIDRIERVVAVESLAGMHGQRSMAATIDKAEDIILGDLLHETDAARAEDAALVIKHDVLPDVDLLRLLDLVVLKSGGGLPVLDRKFLESAFTRLVAD